MLRASIILSFLTISLSGLSQEAKAPAPAPKVQVSKLEDAYQKELVFLRKEKRLLQQRLETQKTSQARDLSALNRQISSLQVQQINLKQRAELLDKEVTEVQSELSDFDEQKLNLETTLLQSNDTLSRYGFSTAAEDQGFIEKLSFNYQQAISALKSMDTVRTVKSDFFLSNGKKTEGEVTYVGQVAAFGKSANGGGVLAPAGNGRLKVWADESGDTISTLEDQGTSTLQLFLFDSVEKDHAAPEAKKLSDTLKAGGTIGWVITLLGIVALLAIVVRALILKVSQDAFRKAEKQLDANLASKDLTEVTSIIEKVKGSTARLVELALKNMNSKKFEDIVAEGYIEHTSKLDRFNTFILVVSAVAPLLGLLGTVTGMIATFDIITEVGTGDPKLLSSGISEALITTMFGLIVAIPALLLGNLLSSWAETLKGEMEKLVLKVSNRYDHAA